MKSYKSILLLFFISNLIYPQLGEIDFNAGKAKLDGENKILKLSESVEIYFNDFFLQADEINLDSSKEILSGKNISFDLIDRNAYGKADEILIQKDKAQFKGVEMSLCPCKKRIWWVETDELSFSSQEDFNTWAPASTNTAGSFRIQDGSKIVAAVRSRGSILVWTDTALHALNNIGPPFIFGLNQIGANCGAISANAVADVNGVTFWMSQTAFYSFDGAIKKLDCTVQDFVFDDINATASGQISIAINTDFNEVTWFYASESSSFLNRSVTYNYLENVWYTNDGFTRTSWVDRGVYSKPYAVLYDSNSLPNNNTILGVTAGCTTLYEHEEGFNDDGAAMDCQITSGDFDIKEGDEVFLCSRVIPDFKDQSGNTDVKIEFANYPASTNTRSFTSTTTPTTKFFSVRGRGRQANVKISSDAVDSNWRFGTIRLDIQPDGKR